MTKLIPLARVERLQIYINQSKKTLAQIKAETGADYLMNGGLYEGTHAVCHLRSDGYTWAEDPYTYQGYRWDQGPDISMGLIPDETARNFICCVALLRDGKPLDLIYGKELGGARPRTAMGLMGDKLCLYCTSQGMTPEQLRAELLALGWDSAVMLDGGGSSQCDFGAAGTITASRKVHNLILVYLKKDGGQMPPKEETMGTYKVTATVGLNIRTTPDKNAGKVGAYRLGAIVTVLETRDGWGRTDKGWVSLAYLEPVQADRTPDNGLTIRRDYIPQGRANRPGKANPDTYITIHETGNFAATADANAHATYLKSDSAAQSKVSWHYTVDDRAVVQHLPDGETAYHAGDGAGGPGNATSIGIEICVNQGGDFEKAKRNAAALVRLLMKEHGVPLDRVVQHNHWNGKDCPKTIRATKGAWEAFLGLCGGQDGKDEPWYSEALKWATGLGITDGERPDDAPTRAELWVTLYRYEAAKAGK